MTFRLLIALIGIPVPAFGAPGISVWAIGDSYRINPMNGKAWEDNTLLFPDALTGNYKTSNLVWDGARRRISLRSARNETVAFQVVIERAEGAALKGVGLSTQDWTSSAGRISKDSIGIYKEWYVNVKKRSAQSFSLGTGWYPDALIPVSKWTGKLFPASYVMPFNIPDLMNNLGPDQRNHTVWVEVYVPKDRKQVPAGNYTSKLTVSSDAGKVDLELQLEVWDFMLPEENHLAGNIHTDTELNTFSPELELKYYQLMRRHRLAMGVLGYAPETKVAGSGIDFDWTSYDRRLSRYLDGTAFTKKYGYEGPGEGIPIEMLVLPFDVYPVNEYFTSRHPGYPYGKEWKFYRPWPVDIPERGITPEYGEIWSDAFRKFERHFDDHPEWNRTKPIVFLLSLDESYDQPSVEKIEYFGRLLKKSGAKRLKYRIDGSYPMDTMDRLARVVDIAILGVRSYVPERVQQLRKNGVEDWFYSGMGFTDGDPLGCRAMGWVSYRYGAASWTIWESDFNSLRAWQYPDTYREENGDVQNGLGMLIYRGETMGLDEPVASIRLKLLRRGSQDYEYARLLASTKGGKEMADAIVRSVVNQPLGSNGTWGSPSMWKHNPEDWERARFRMGELITTAVSKQAE